MSGALKNEGFVNTAFAEEVKGATNELVKSCSASLTNREMHRKNATSFHTPQIGKMLKSDSTKS